MPDKYLLEHAEQWKTIKLNGLHLNIISSISDATISPTNPNWKYWFDREKKTLNVILPAIKSEGELDDIIISGAMSQGGLSTFLSESQLDSLALSVFKACPEALQRSLLGQVLGDSGSNEAKIAAGKRRIIDSAMAAYKTSYKSQESNDWFIIVNNHIRNYLRHVVSFMSLSRPLFANAIGKGIRQNLSRLDNEMTLSNLNASSESLKEIIVELAERERKRLSIDRKRVITLGSVPEILIRYSPRIRHDALLELPLSALYGHQDNESPKRFVVVGVDKTKRDKHPFNLYEIKNFKESLASPLAIFNSTKNRLSTTVMLPNRCEFGNIFVPITRKKNSKNDSGFGRWINTIDSVYPKDALNYIFLLSDKKNTLYVKDGFMEEWLVPAVKNLDDACEKKAKKFGINLPSDEECKKILSEYPERAHYEEENAEGPIKRLLSAVDLNGPSGFLRMYAEYRVALESATKVVKEFENPKIIEQENIEFSMNGDNTESLNKNSEEYQLATDMAMFMADKLNEHGIKTVVVPEKEAKKVLEESYKKDIRQRLSVALRTMQPEGFTSPQIVNINAKVSKISESANKIKDLITEAEAGRRIGNHEFLFEIAKCLGYDESKRSLENQHKKSDGNAISIYADFDNGTRLRISTHYATAKNFLLGNHPSNNVGIVIRLLKNKFHKDKSVSYIENVYFPDKLSEARKLALLKGILSFIQTGNFLDLPLPDKVNTSPEFSISLDKQQNTKQEFRLADGTIYGYQQGDTIYLTPAGINPNTPIHEYAHLWAKVYEKLRPEEWNALKEELKATPQWTEIANSTSYSFIDNDENRLAGEVLATIVGNKGEELQMRAAKETLEDSSRRKTTSRREVKDAAARFKNIVTDMAVKDVFDADGMERTGEVTLKVLQDFAKGKGLKITKEEGKKLAAMAEFDRARVKASEYVSKSNRKFNEELQMQIEGKFDSEPHTYNLGYPGPILRSTGIPNLPIQVSSTKLSEKSNSDKHKYNLNEIKDLVKHINAPVAVFSYGDGTLAQNIIIDIEHDNSHFLVGLSLNAHIKGVALEINSIRNVFPKDDYKWIEWIQEGKTRYMDKETIKALLAQQRTNPADVNHLDLDFVANIVEKFENPKVDEKYFIIDNWQYYGVFLDDKSQSIINREFRDLIPSDWKKYADHITVQYNDYSQDAISKGRALSSELGHEYSAQIVAVGKTDTAIALKVEGIETANKIAHITLAVSPEGRPVDSNKITEWNPVGPIEINGALGLSYKGKKYFHVLDDNEVVDFKIGKHSLNQQETNMDNIYLSDLDRHGVEHFRFEHIMPSRVLRGATDHSVPIHASSKMCDDAGIVGNHNRMGIPVIALRGKEYISVPPGGVYLVEEGKGNYKLLSKEAFDKRFTIVEALSENGEKTLICVRAGTKLNFAQAAAESMDKHNLNSIDILSIDSKTLSKAALFVAWELREDNPYEFIVDLSRAELEDFVKNSFNKLNAEDKDVVMNILKKTPGYGEDFVEKRINTESHFKPDIETLLVDDLTVGGDVLDRSMFYIATRNMNDEQVQALRDSVKEKVMAYYAGIEMDAPNASMEKAEADTEKLLNSWFRPWTRLAGRLEYHLDKIQNGNEGPVALRHIEAEARDAMTDERYAPYIERELKGWIRNRCADYGLDYTKLPEDLQFEGAAETYRQMSPEYVKDTKIDTLTRDAILAHIDKITALYPQYPQEPTQVSRKPDGSIVRQYGEFEYEQLKGGFERSKNLVLIEEVDPSSLQRLALYTMSSDSYGEHPNGPYVKFWDNGNIRSYEDRTVRLGSDNEFESDMLSFTREGIVQEKIPGDYPIDPFLEDITKEYMKNMTQREGLEPNATIDLGPGVKDAQARDIKIDSEVLSTWFVFLPLEDKMRVFGYYHNNPEVEESPIGILENVMDVEKLEKAYKTAVETPFDIPEIDDTVVRVSVEKELNTAFDSLSDASKEQIYRETVAAGIPGIEPSHSQNATAQESVAGSRVYGTLISSLSQAYHEKYKEDGITLEIATTWAQELAVRIEETIGGGNFFYPGRIDAESLTNAIGKDYDESDRQLVLDELSVMLRPFSFSIERTSEIQSPFTFAIPITSDFAFKLNDNHILGIGASPGADMLESFVRQGLGDTSPLSIEEVKGKIDSFASECKVVISLDNLTLEQRPFNDLDVCLDIISMTGMAGRDDRILVKEKSLAGGTIYTVANELLLSSGVSVFNVQLDENGRLLGYSDANANIVVSYANDGAVYSVNKQAWGEEGSQPQVKTYYTTQLIVNAFEDIKKHLSEKNINQLQEQIEALQEIEMPLRKLSINLISETIPQSRYLTSDMLERFDALKSAVSQQMGKELKKFNDAIHLVADNTPNMNLFELEGAFNKISMIEHPFLSICEKNKDVSDAFNLARDFKLTLTNLEKAVSQAEKDYEQYLERGERTNNTLLDRLLGRTFTPHFPLPSKAEIEEYNVASERMLYARDSFQLFASSLDPNTDVLSIFNSLLENNQASIEAVEHERVVKIKPISLGELTSLPLDYERQLEITGRIDGPVCLSNPGGEDVLVCVQKDGDSLISMRSDDIKSAIDKISSQEEPMFSVNVDGQHYQMRKDNYDSFKYGQGAYAVNADTGEKAYLIFDVKEKKVVKTEKFETVLSKKLQEEKSKADKAMAQSVGQKTEAPTQKRGGGMKKS